MAAVIYYLNHFLIGLPNFKNFVHIKIFLKMQNSNSNTEGVYERTN